MLKGKKGEFSKKFYDRFSGYDTPSVVSALAEITYNQEQQIYLLKIWNGVLTFILILSLIF